jgi:hypothetical protein
MTALHRPHALLAVAIIAAVAAVGTIATIAAGVIDAVLGAKEGKGRRN